MLTSVSVPFLPPNFSRFELNLVAFWTLHCLRWLKRKATSTHLHHSCLPNIPITLQRRAVSRLQHIKHKAGLKYTASPTIDKLGPSQKCFEEGKHTYSVRKKKNVSGTLTFLVACYFFFFLFTHEHDQHLPGGNLVTKQKIFQLISVLSSCL